MLSGLSNGDCRVSGNLRRRGNRYGIEKETWYHLVVILFGGVVIYLAMKKWVILGRTSQNYAPAEIGGRDEQYRRWLEKELEEFAERSFR